MKGAGRGKGNNAKGGSKGSGINAAEEIAKKSKRQKRQEKLATLRKDNEDMRTAVMNLDNLVTERVSSMINIADALSQGNAVPPSQSGLVAGQAPQHQQHRQQMSTMAPAASTVSVSTAEARAALARMNERFNNLNQ